MKNMPKWLFPFSLLIMGFLYLPIVIIVVYSFNQSKINATWTGFTFDWYISMFQNSDVLEALFNSLSIAGITSAISTIIGTCAAIAFRKYQFKWSKAWYSLFFFTILVPDLLMGISLLLLFSFLGIPLGKLTIIVTHITFCIPFVFIILSTRLASVGKDLEEAAQDLGAPPLYSFWHITLPILTPAIVSSILLTFSLSLDDFMISFFVAGPGATTLPIYIYGMIKRGITPEVNALASLLVVATFILVILAEFIRRRGEKESNIYF